MAMGESIKRIVAVLHKRWAARVIKWEDRYVIQYEKQIAESLAGIEEAKARRAKAAAFQTSRRGRA